MRRFLVLMLWCKRGVVEMHRKQMLLVSACLVLLMASPLATMDVPSEERYLEEREGTPPPAGEAPVMAPMPMLPEVETVFLENRGQLERDDIMFYIDGASLSVGFCRDRLVLVMRNSAEKEGLPGDRPPVGMDVFSFELVFDGCLGTAPEGRGEVACRSNFFVGRDRDRWASGVPGFEEVVYTGLYDGVDMRFYVLDGRLKYDLRLESATVVERICLRYEGVDGVEVEALTGDLLVRTPLGVLRDTRPFVVVPSTAQHLDAEFVMTGPTSAGYRIPSRIQAGTPVVIDPGLEYGTFIGGKSVDALWTVSIDPKGDILVAGCTRSAEFPRTSGLYPNETGGAVGYVMKFEPTLSKYLFSTIFGSNEIGGYTDNNPAAISTLSDGGIMVTGNTEQKGFATTASAYQSEKAAALDAYIMILSPEGDEVRYLSYFGGNGNDNLWSHELDANGDLNMVFHTTSKDLPTTSGAYQSTNNGDADIYFVRWDHDLTAPAMATYVGGSRWDASISLEFDDDGDILLPVATYSRDFPTTPGAYCETCTWGTTQAGLIKLSRSGSLLYSTYLPVGSDGAQSYFPYLADKDLVHILGWTNSAGLPVTEDALDRTLGGSSDGFIMTFNISSSEIEYLSYFGGNGDEDLYGSVWDPVAKRLSWIGSTDSTDLRWTEGCYCPIYTGNPKNAMLVCYDTIEHKMTYTTWIGSWGSGYGIYFPYMNTLVQDASGCFYVALDAYDSTLPVTSHGNKTTVDGFGIDGLLMKIDPRPVDRPAAPVDLVAVASDAMVNLSWTPVLNESYVIHDFVVYRGETPSALLPVGHSGRNTTYTDSQGLVNGRTYHYSVVAVNSAGESDRCPSVSVVPLGLPRVPRDVRLSNENGTIVMTWAAPYDTGGDLKGYHVQRGERADALELLAEVGADQTSFRDAPPVLGRPYFYTVRAFNARGNGTDSRPQSIAAIATPGPPMHLSLTAGDRWVDLAWERPESNGGAPLYGYHILRGIGLDDMVALPAVLLPTTLSYRDAPLINGLTYYYCVRAYNIEGEGTPTATMSEIPLGVPTEPRDLTAKAGDGQVLLEWQPPRYDGGGPVTKYVLSWRAGTDGAVARLELPALTSYPMSGLENEVTYFFSLEAMNFKGLGPSSITVNATPLAIPGAPTGLTATPFSVGLLLGWDVPQGTTGTGPLSYIVHRSEQGGRLRQVAETDVPLYRDTDVTPGSSYAYTVTAVNGNGGRGPASQELPVLMPQVPRAPASLVATAGDGRVVLSWSPPSFDGGTPIIAYRILRGLEGSEPDTIMGVVGTEHLDLNVSNGATYVYKVVAINAVGEGPPSVTATATPVRPPGAPTDFSVEVVDGEVRLTWGRPSDGGPDVTGYRVLRGRAIDELQVIADRVTGLTFNDGDVRGGNTYYYEVVALIGDVDGTPTEARKVAIEGEGTSPILAVVLVAVVLLVAIALVVYGRRRD